MSALDLIEQQLGSRRKAPAAVLSNISVLHQSLNKLDKVGLCLPLMVFFVFGDSVAWFLFALCVGSRIQHSEFAVRIRYSACHGRRPEQSAHTVFELWVRRCLLRLVWGTKSQAQAITLVRVIRALTYSAKYYSQEICQLAFVNSDGDGGMLTFEAVSDHSIDLTKVLAAGFEIRLNDVRLVVRSITASTVQCLNGVVPVNSLEEGALLALRVKKSLHNFNDSTVTYCYNFARLLEDSGSTNAAAEVYVGLLKRHPSFIECKKCRNTA